MLQGLVVLELGASEATGALGGLQARLGAAVLLVEPASADHGEWAQRAAVAAGKHSVVPAPQGDGPTLQQLLACADVVLLSSDCSAFELAVWDGERPAAQVLCDITAFGHSGPLAGQRASEAAVQALAGVADTTGRRDGAPVVTGAPFLAMETAVYALAAILTALQVRKRSGLGQRIDMGLYDVAVNALLTFIPLHLTGSRATRNGNRHPTLAPWNAYRASDGWVLICAPTNDQWRRLCVAMDAPQLLQDARFASTTSRFEHVEALDAEIGRWAGALRSEDCLQRVGAQGIPCSSIVALAELAGEPNLVHRAMVQELRDPASGGTVRIPGSPFRVHGEAAWRAGAVPARGSGNAFARALAAGAQRPPRVHGDVAIAGRPLQGLRVVEIGMNTVAPLAGRQLGALGADVIKVEPPSGDANRVNAPLREDGESYVFALSNTDKRGVVLDLRDAAAREVLWRLLASADMVIENLKPGSLARLGFGAQEVLERLPQMIYCSVSGFGADSSYPGRPALDTVVQAMSGAMSATPVDGVPTKAGISISDQLGGQFGLAALLAALERRQRTGHGLYLDLAMQDASAWATHTLWNAGAHQGVARVQATGERYVLVEDGDRSTPIASVDEVMVHPHTLARGLVREVPSPDGSGWVVLGSPLKLLSTPAEVRCAMPRLGFPEPELLRELDAARLPLAPEQEHA